MPVNSTPNELLAQVKNGGYTLKHIQDVSMLFIHHYLLSCGFVIADAQGTPLQALPTTWNASPNMVFLRYTRSDIGNITCKFGRKENGTMDMQLKTPKVSKSFKFKTFLKEQLPGVINSSSGIDDIDTILNNANGVVQDMMNNLLQVMEVVECGAITTSTTTITPAPIMEEHSINDNNNKPTQQQQPQYFLQHNVEITPATTPIQQETLSPLPTNVGNHPNSTVMSNNHVNNNNMMLTSSPALKNHIIGDPSSTISSSSPQALPPSQSTSPSVPQPIELTLPKMEKGFDLPTDPVSTTSTIRPTNDQHLAAAVQVPTLPSAPIIPPSNNNNTTSSPPPSYPDPFNPLQQQRQPPSSSPSSQPSLPFDPYTGQMNPGQMTDRGFRTPGPDFNDPFNGGNLMGPGQFSDRGRNLGGFNGGPGINGPGAPGSFAPPHGARFDPYGPGPGMGEPNYDHMRRPGNPQQQQPRRGGGLNGPNNGNFNGYF